MDMTTQTKTPSTSPCGCSGTAKPAASPCRCGGKGPCGQSCSCQESCGGQEFRRPVFFEGQLLTEDDLQALESYVVRKNRLHMRHFWGDGVVCGLDVQPHPCSKSKLIVSPGYALDCCGNDIVLACPKELDIRQMVRDLQASMKGYDCGDPCEDQDAEERPQFEQRPFDPAEHAFHETGVPSHPQPETPKPPAPARREYCLYIRYCEQSVEPMTAYGTGQQCGVPACYPTRTLEGVQFELRCRPRETPPDDFASRLCRCLRDYQSDKADRILAVDTIKSKWAEALKESASGQFAFDRNEYSASAKAATAAVQKPIDDTEKLNKAVEAASALLKQSARYYVVPPGERKQLATARQVSEAQHALDSLSKALASEKAKELIAAKPVLEREYVTELTDRLMEFAAFGEDSVLKEADKPLLHGVVINDRLLKTFEDEIAVSRSEITRIRERAGVSFTPRPHEAPPPAAFGAPSIVSSERLSTDLERWETVRTETESLVADCFCANLNPPCLPCEDLGVLLACFAWEDCEVHDLCILERKFVLTPNNLRYWLPGIGLIGELIEALCCPGKQDRLPRTLISKMITLLFATMGPAALRDCLGRDYIPTAAQRMKIEAPEGNLLTKAMKGPFAASLASPETLLDRVLGALLKDDPVES
jgi:hypothetical protein